MNKVVRRDMPAGQLPAALGKGFDPAEIVSVVVSARLGPGAAGPSASDQFGRFRHLRRGTFRSSDEVVAHVRALRDEWD